jgi:hypothetical protein
MRGFSVFRKKRGCNGCESVAVRNFHALCVKKVCKKNLMAWPVLVKVESPDASKAAMTKDHLRGGVSGISLASGYAFTIKTVDRFTDLETLAEEIEQIGNANGPLSN